MIGNIGDYRKNGGQSSRVGIGVSERIVRKRLNSIGRAELRVRRKNADHLSGRVNPGVII
ncbi:MAG: hypothetical protein ACL93V_08215 [Candidatus Electrothrix sp. YB6]